MVLDACWISLGCFIVVCYWYYVWYLVFCFCFVISSVLCGDAVVLYCLVWLFVCAGLGFDCLIVRLRFRVCLVIYWGCDGLLFEWCCLC